MSASQLEPGNVITPNFISALFLSKILYIFFYLEKIEIFLKVIFVKITIMKHLFFIALFTLSAFKGFSQKELLFAEGTAGQIKKIYNHNIKRLEGNNSASSITNVSYQDAESMMNKLKESAKERNWEKSKLNKELDVYQEHAKGGIVQLYVLRDVIEKANVSNFTVHIIKGGKEVQTKKLVNTPGKASKMFAPHFESTNFMWIAEKIEVPFEIQVEEKNSTGSVWYKFEVNL